jgi:hypothetical protein
MPELDRRSRTAFALAAFAAFAGAYVTTPIAARSAAGTTPTVAPLPAPVPEPSRFAVVLPRRDPFAGALDTAAAGSARSDDARLSMPSNGPNDATWPHGLAPLPPNAGAAAMAPPFATVAAQSLAPAAQPLSARATALITGAHPYALLDDAGTTRLVTLGDRIGGTTIAAIFASGIRLADGRTLPLVTDPAPPRSVPAAPPAPSVQTLRTDPIGPSASTAPPLPLVPPVSKGR